MRILLLICFLSIFSCKERPTEENTMTLDELLYFELSYQKENNEKLISEVKLELNTISDSIAYKTKFLELEKLNYNLESINKKTKYLKSNIDTLASRRPCVMCPRRPYTACCPKLRFVKIPINYKEKSKSEILKTLNISDSLKNDFELVKFDDSNYLKISDKS